MLPHRDGRPRSGGLCVGRRRPPPGTRPANRRARPPTAAGHVPRNPGPRRRLARPGPVPRPPRLRQPARPGADAPVRPPPEPEPGVVAELFAGLSRASTHEAAPPAPVAPAVDYEEVEILRLQNAELRNLVEQAIAQEEEFTRAQQQWEQQQAEFAQRLD